MLIIFRGARIKGNKTHGAPLECSETAAVFAFFVASINTAAAKAVSNDLPEALWLRDEES
jgi:hypothetical protein